MTEHNTYIVQAVEDRWAIRLEEETLGTFEGRHEAIQAAVAVAEASGRAGNTVEIISAEEYGEMIPIWEVGRDILLDSIGCLNSILRISLIVIAGWRSSGPDVGGQPEHHLDSISDGFTHRAHTSIFQDQT
ncbi:hypothetical protein [Microvirga lotononidis]|uniref:DUF2188 domain-containing protein n=1 Tax=Microvirga lotononidis TaxID=864069 RepID=I4YSA3_9HYPH|nr:hypothetical protein [Microvirga lotononidis]EIM26845.1 hypothetical protein MicloDRAFT_00033960 [Microvirga lotononidis]WQO31402.1 hypothetical protein U0023_34530 [Microvirga lotononidis]